MRSFPPTRGVRLSLALGLGLVFGTFGLMGFAPLRAQHRQPEHRQPQSRQAYRQPQFSQPQFRQPQYRQQGGDRDYRPAPSSGRAHVESPGGSPYGGGAIGPRAGGQMGGQSRSQLAPNNPNGRNNPPLHDERDGRNEHLAQWMGQHSNLSPEQQQQALDREPGFRNLPRQTQQHMRNRLAQLDAMPPRQRQRMLAHTEMMERLNPGQRAQVRGAMQQLGALPSDQRHAVARSFRELRQLPQDQRSAAINSYRWMSPAQRATLDHLLQVEPMLPPPGR